MDNKKMVIVTLGGGTPHRTERRQCVRFAVSEQISERRFETR